VSRTAVAGAHAICFSSQELETDRHEEDCCKRATVIGDSSESGGEGCREEVGAEESGPGGCTERSGDWRSV
jgi:hypothetical protein